MTPSITAVRMSGAKHRAELPLLVLGPSLGTTAATLWTACAAQLVDAFDVLAWDLPGHGHNRGVPDEPFTLAQLAAGVLAVVDDVLVERDELGGSFSYAGDSVGGAVGLQLLLDVPERVRDAVLLCTGARIGDDESWADRIEQVTASGTAAQVSTSADRWFAPGFLDRQPETASALLNALRDSKDEGYLQVCAALRDFDVRDRLSEITAPVLAVSGTHDAVTPRAGLAAIADGVRDGELVELDGVAHLAPAEAPEEVARLIRRHVLGEVHDQATAADLTRDFQEFIRDYAGGGAWDRSGLDRRSRSLITLTALVARGHHDELALHVRAARSNGVTIQEIKELLLQTAMYCGVPSANTASRIAHAVLDEEPS